MDTTNLVFIIPKRSTGYKFVTVHGPHLFFTLYCNLLYYDYSKKNLVVHLHWIYLQQILQAIRILPIQCQTPCASVPNLAISLSIWMQMSSMDGREAIEGWSIHVTNWRRVSGYGGFGPGGQFTLLLITASCTLSTCSPSALSKGDIPYL